MHLWLRAMAKPVLRGMGANLLAAVLLCPLAACQQRPRAKEAHSHVEHGELYASGSATHDEYLANIHDLQIAVAAATIEERDVRMGIALQLHLLPTADADRILSHLERIIPKMPKHRGKLEDSPGGRRVRITAVDGPPDGTTAEFMRVLEEACTGHLTISNRLANIPDRARRMKDIGKPLLESAEKDFSSPTTRDDVTRELRASLRVLDELASEAQEISRRTRFFVDQAIVHLEAGQVVDAPAKKPVETKPAKKHPAKHPDFTP